MEAKCNFDKNSCNGMLQRRFLKKVNDHDYEVDVNMTFSLGALIYGWTSIWRELAISQMDRYVNLKVTWLVYLTIHSVYWRAVSIDLIMSRQIRNHNIFIRFSSPITAFTIYSLTYNLAWGHTWTLLFTFLPILWWLPWRTDPVTNGNETYYDLS